MNKYMGHICGISSYILCVLVAMAAMMCEVENPSLSDNLAVLSIAILVVTFLYSLVLYVMSDL